MYTIGHTQSATFTLKLSLCMSVLIVAVMRLVLLGLFCMARLPSLLPGFCVLGSIGCVHVCTIVRLTVVDIRVRVLPHDFACA